MNFRNLASQQILSIIKGTLIPFLCLCVYFHRLSVAQCVPGVRCVRFVCRLAGSALWSLHLVSTQTGKWVLTILHNYHGAKHEAITGNGL